MAFTLEEIARRIGAELRGDGSRQVEGIRGIEEAEASHVTFVANPKYRPNLLTTRAAGAIVSPDVTEAPLTLLVTPEPYRAFSEVLRIFHPDRRPPPGVSSDAHVDSSAEIAEGVTVSPFVVVGPNVTIGARTVLHPFVVLEEGSAVGADCTLYPHVSLRSGCVLGDRVILHNGVQVGSDGFGFVPEGTRLQKIPQVGIVRIEDDVEVGAGSCIDRATMGATRIGRGTKIDNLVQVAHNVQIGENVILVSQVGISGSTTIGDRTVLAGQTGVAGHLHIGKDVKAAAKTGIISSVKDGSLISGGPCMDHRRHLRVQAVFKKLPEMRNKLRKLEQEIRDLRKGTKHLDGEGEGAGESDP
jgi:UDP-3-O-[3-hydroxymyristoyl] glucosamine N-acyltransferase